MIGSQSIRVGRGVAADNTLPAERTDGGRRYAASAVASAYAYAAVVAVSLALFVYDLPIQVSDSFNHMLNVQGSSLSHILQSYLYQEGYLRPFWWAEIKLVFEAAGPHYYEWFRGLHALQVLVLIALTVTLIRPRTWLDAAVLPLALAVLIGLHTIESPLREAFPIQHYLLVIICCLAVANLAFARHRWWSDAAAGIIFVVASLSLESGLLVWVVAAAAYLVGQRGLSRPGVVLLTLLFAGYFLLHFVLLRSHAPGLVERSSGFGFAVLSPSDIAARFGANPLPFYGYNVMSSILTVLFTEPRSGVFRYTAEFLDEGVPLPTMVNVLSSLLATALLASFVWRRRHAWLRRQFERSDQLALLFLAILPANAILSFPYTKDMIMAPAGAFLAFGVFVAARDFVARSSSWKGARQIAAVGLILLVSVTWAYRAAGAYAGLRTAAVKTRNDWAFIDGWLADQHDIDANAPATISLLRQLQDDAIERHPAPPKLPPRMGRLLDFDQ